jgi:DNA-directed RNA polymerase specialized sigma24 family protein
MGQRRDGQSRLWIRNRDSCGNRVNQELVEAAHRVWDRARLTVIRYLADDVDAPEILEGAVDSASRVLASQRAIRSLEAYLLRSVAREAIRRQRRNQRVVYIDSASLDSIIAPTLIDQDRQLDEAKRFEVLRACLDESGRRMFDLRVLSYSWREIAKLAGYADAHSAEVQYRKKMDKALERFRAYHVLRPKPPRSE